MIRWILPFLLLVFYSNALVAQPRPLPDDSYPQEPRYPEEPPRGPEVPYSLGNGEAERFGNRRTDFYPRSDLNRLVRLRLVGLDNTIEIKEVRLIFADYREERVEFGLNGELKPGNMRGTLLGGRRIYAIEVTATASYLWKKPGGYRVEVTAVR